ncbi:hypothetical protein BOTCAL_0034g00310 [Botryotinia calthae]|uniref:Uncharacterized protein n=1 Tax=Botryotinia calthae TaxID=38488 RepID=A0A4Y8DDF3_9HELO|nr:hypothetical protein BOTCAL_0034g00310 [Botryotinia calthae]
MDQFFTENYANTLGVYHVIEDRQVLLQRILDQVVAIPGMTQELTSKFVNLYREFEGLLVATPAPALAFRYGHRVAIVTFHSLKNVGKNDDGDICVHHLWKGDCGFVLVEDIFLFSTKSQIFRHNFNRSPLVRRRTTLLNSEQDKLYCQPMMYEIISRADRLMMGTWSGSLLPQDRVCFYIERFGLEEFSAEEANILLPEEHKVNADDDDDVLSGDDSMLEPRIIHTPATSSAADTDEFTIQAHDNSDPGEDEQDYSDSEDDDAQDDATERYQQKIQGQEEWTARDTNHVIYLVATLRTRLGNVAARERDVEDREAILKTETAALERQKIDQENMLAVRAASIEKQKVDQETALATRAITLTRRGMDRENALVALYHERGLGPMLEMPQEADANYCTQFRKGEWGICLPSCQGTVIRSTKYFNTFTPQALATSILSADRELNMAGTQTNLLADKNSFYENEVNRLLEMIRIHPVYGTSFFEGSLVKQSKEIKLLLLTSSEPSLIFRFGLENRDVTFVRANSANFGSSKQVFALEHLWKIPGGYVLVQDLMYFNIALKEMPLRGSPFVQRLITLLDIHEKNPGFERMNCSLVVRNGIVFMVKKYNKKLVPFSNGSSILNQSFEFLKTAAVVTSKTKSPMSQMKEDRTAATGFLLEDKIPSSTLLAREATVKATETALDLREAAVKASEDALRQREDVMESEKATIKNDQENLKLYESNLRYKEERLRKKDEKLNREFTNRELLVTEREQKIETMEGASKMGWVIPMAISKDVSDDLYKWMGRSHEVET